MQEILAKYTGLDDETISKALRENDNRFWEALHWLFKPAHPKSRYLDQLKDAGDDTAAELLGTLKSFYYNEGYSNTMMAIMFDERPFYEEVGLAPRFEADPEPGEVPCYFPFLHYDAEQNKEIVFAALDLFRWIPLPQGEPTFDQGLGSLLRHRRSTVANKALEILSDRGDYIDRFFPDIRFNLRDDREMNHFRAVRALWSREAGVYGEIIPQLEHLMETTCNSQVQSMCSDLLIRYGECSEEEISRKEEEKRQAQVESIRREVNRMKTSGELHDFADSFNWDDDIEYLRAVISHSECDLSTARMIYWRGCPDYYLTFSEPEEIPSCNREVFELLTRIEERVELREFKVCLSPWNPRDDHGYDRTKGVSELEDAARTIPEYMYKDGAAEPIAPVPSCSVLPDESAVGLSDYLFFMMSKDINSSGEPDISREDLPFVFGLDTNAAKSIALRLFGRNGRLEDFSASMRSFYRIYRLRLLLLGDRREEAAVLLQEDPSVRDEISGSGINAGELFRFLKEGSGTPECFLPWAEELKPLEGELARKVLGKMIPPEEGVKNWCIAGNCREDEENQMILWEDFFWTLVQMDLEWMLDVLRENNLDFNSLFAAKVLVKAGCRYNNPAMLEAMISRGADLTEPVFKDIILSAVGWNRVDDPAAAEILIRQGADINVKSPPPYDEEKTALHIALAVPHYRTAMTLLDAGADVNAVDKNNQNAPLQLLSGMWSRPEESRTTLTLMKEVLQRGAEVNVMPRDGRCALFRCAHYGLEEMFDLLISHGGDLEFRKKSTGETPLLLACKKGELETARFLVDHGADINAADKYGFSALHLSLIAGISPKGFKPVFWEIIKFLLHRGIDRDIRSVKSRKVKKHPIESGTTSRKLAEILNLSEAAALLEQES